MALIHLDARDNDARSRNRLCFNYGIGWKREPGPKVRCPLVQSSYQFQQPGLVVFTSFCVLVLHKKMSGRSLMLEDIPDDVLLNVLQFLDYREVGKCSKVSKRFNELSRDNNLWYVYPSTSL